MVSTGFLLRKEEIKYELVFVCLICRKLEQTKSKQNLLQYTSGFISKPVSASPGNSLNKHEKEMEIRRKTL